MVFGNGMMVFKICNIFESRVLFPGEKLVLVILLLLS